MSIYVCCYVLINITEEGVDTNPELYININFTTGSINASFDIVTASDNVLEGNQTINVSIFSITNGHSLGTPAAATVTIIDTTGMYVCSCFYNIALQMHHYNNASVFLKLLVLKCCA